MLTATTMLDMLRLRTLDPHRAITEAVLLRAEIDRLDDWLIAIDEHLATDHDGDDCTQAAIELTAAIRHRLRVSLARVERALDAWDPDSGTLPA
jgi:hypothetical protein